MKREKFTTRPQWALNAATALGHNTSGWEYVFSHGYRGTALSHTFLINGEEFSIELSVRRDPLFPLIGSPLPD